jgi:hypothetical protein
MVGVILIFAFAMSLLIEYVETKINATDKPVDKTNEVVENKIVREPE